MTTPTAQVASPHANNFNANQARVSAPLPTPARHEQPQAASGGAVDAEAEADADAGAGAHGRWDVHGSSKSNEDTRQSQFNREIQPLATATPLPLPPETESSRDIKHRSRPCTAEKQDAKSPGLNGKPRVKRAKMDDLTQKSSMSLTQENPDWVNEPYNLHPSFLEVHPSASTPEDEDPPAPAPGPYGVVNGTTARTQSTAFTYEENDTGHINLAFNLEPEAADADDAESEEPSQDASFTVAPALQHSSHSYEPRTPAPPVNPFLQKGSVMKGAELFGATQPSSIGRHVASPISSRPSPDVYNGFSSPPKRQAFISSSPLARRPDLDLPEQESEANESTPLQSSVRNTLGRSLSAGNSAQIAQSLDAVLRKKRQNTEPRAYVSMKESQEKRQRRRPVSEPSESDDSDDDIQSRVQQKKRDRKVMQELAKVGVSRKRMPSTAPRSSVPRSSNTPAIEVPSTGRRRSVQEEYIAQCSGFDARDTQQDDVIADSQANINVDSPTHQSTPQAMELPKLLAPGKNDLKDEPIHADDEETEDEAENEEEDSSGKAPAEVDHNIHPEVSSNPEMIASGRSLPLHEVFAAHRNHVQTPTRDNPETVPETSPLEERLRPMGEIATISFDRQDSAMDNLPGFTQDDEFNMAMQIKTSPNPFRSRSSSFRRHASSNVSKGVGSPVARQVASNISSSALSSLASSPADPADIAMHEETPIREGPIDIEQRTDTGPPRAHKHHAGTDHAAKDKAATATPGQESTNTDQASETAREVPAEGSLDATPQPEVTIDQEQGLADVEVQNEAVSKDTEPPETPIADASAAETLSKTAFPTPRKGLKTYSNAKAARGSKRLGIGSLAAATNSSDSTPYTSSRTVKATPKAQAVATATPISMPRATPRTTPRVGVTDSSTEKSAVRSTAKPPPISTKGPAAPQPAKRAASRRSGATVVLEHGSTTRSSRRQSTANLKDSSPDPLALPSPITATRSAPGLFGNMTFAVSYVAHEREKNEATKLIYENGGRILPDGFDSLFESPKSGSGDDSDMTLSPSAKSTGFVALIADEHSRKAKYMQALALGLPCISGHWLTACVHKFALVDWSPYLLCAGQSAVLGNAHKSRVLQPYPAADASFREVFAKREKLLEGRSVLLITAKGKHEKRKAYSFLARALGPARIGQVSDYQEARKKLFEGQDGHEREWDMLYVDTHEKVAEAAVFGTPTVSSSAPRKRKRGAVPAVADDSPAPKKIRIISDETMIQSLILGQLLDN